MSQKPIELITAAFIYQWKQLSTGKWYIGSHYSKGCHPGDGYICSSKTVRPLIESDPTDWVREILQIGNDPKIIQLQESEILSRRNARMDPMSYNETNADGNFSRHGPHSEETKQKMRDNHANFEGSNNPMYGTARDCRQNAQRDIKE